MFMKSTAVKLFKNDFRNVFTSVTIQTMFIPSIIPGRAAVCKRNFENKLSNPYANTVDYIYNRC